MARPKVALLTRPAVTAAAIEMIDAHGLDAFSMRQLADRFEVNVASLYHHFRNREDLLRAVHQVILSEVPTPRPQDSWQDTLVNTAIAYRRALLCHPGCIALMTAIPPMQKSPILYEQFLAELASHGVEADAAAALIDGFEALVLGWITLELSRLGNSSRKSERGGTTLSTKAFERLCRALADGLTGPVDAGTLLR